MKPRITNLLYSCAALLFLFSAGCAEQLVATNNGDGNTPIGDYEIIDGFTCQAGAMGIAADGAGYKACVDATNYDNFVYFHLSDRTVVTPADAQNSTEWDLAFKRFYIALNGGASGSGGMQAGFVEGQSYDSITQVPSGLTYYDDLANDQNADGFQDYVFTSQPPDPDPVNAPILVGWFDYQIPAILNPRDVVYFVHAVDGAYYKVELLDYYDDVGTSGYLQLRWAPVLAP